jgi:hypothetical protein
VSDKQKAKEERAVIGKAKKNSKAKGGKNLRKPAFKLAVPEPKSFAPDDEAPGFTLGTLFKLLLIAGIVIAIFLFLGGQALQIKKSWQKSE